MRRSLQTLLSSVLAILLCAVVVVLADGFQSGGLPGTPVLTTNSITFPASNFGSQQAITITNDAVNNVRFMNGGTTYFSFGNGGCSLRNGANIIALDVANHQLVNYNWSCVGWFTAIGFASTATNTYTMGAGGYINNGFKTVRVYNFSGTGVYFTNTVSGVGFSLPTPIPFTTLNPHEGLIGTSCTVAGIVDE